MAQEKFLEYKGRPLVRNGNTVYYFKSEGRIFTADISVSPLLPFIKEGDRIVVVANASDDGVYVISKIK